MELSPLQRRVQAADLPLDRLAASSQVSEQEKMKAAARAFEAVLLRQILESAQKTLIASEFNQDSTVSSIYRDMVTTQLAESIAQSGEFGLARSFEHQWKRLAPEPPTAASPPPASTPDTPTPTYPRPEFHDGPRLKPFLHEPDLQPYRHE